MSLKRLIFFITSILVVQAQEVDLWKGIRMSPQARQAYVENHKAILATPGYAQLRAAREALGDFEKTPKGEVLKGVVRMSDIQTPDDVLKALQTSYGKPYNPPVLPVLTPVVEILIEFFIHSGRVILDQNSNPVRYNPHLPGSHSHYMTCLPNLYGITDDASALKALKESVFKNYTSLIERQEQQKPG